MGTTAYLLIADPDMFALEAAERTAASEAPKVSFGS